MVCCTDKYIANQSGFVKSQCVFSEINDNHVHNSGRLWTVWKFYPQKAWSSIERLHISQCLLGPSSVFNNPWFNVNVQKYDMTKRKILIKGLDFLSCWQIHLYFHVQPTLNSNNSMSATSIQSSHKSKNSALNVLQANDPSKSSQSRSMPSIGTGQGQIFSDIGLYKGIVVAIKHIKKDHIQITRQVLLEFNEVSSHKIFCLDDCNQLRTWFLQISNKIMRP